MQWNPKSASPNVFLSSPRPSWLRRVWRRIFGLPRGGVAWDGLASPPGLRRGEVYFELRCDGSTFVAGKPPEGFKPWC